MSKKFLIGDRTKDEWISVLDTENKKLEFTNHLATAKEFKGFEDTKNELKKLIAKKAEVEARITETQEQIQEETNIEIHEMVHAAHLTPEQLADVLAAFKKGSIPVNAMDMITEEETDHD